MSGNIAFSDLSANSSASWCKAELIDNTSSMQAQSKRVKFIGDQPVNTTRATQSDAATSYSLKLSLDENVTPQPRNATITVKSKDGKTSATLKVVQKVANVSFGQGQIELSAASQTKQVSFTSELDISKLRVKSSTDWCKVDFGASKKYIQIECEENLSKDSRKSTITLQSTTGESLAKLEVVQDGVIFEVSNSKISFDKSANYRTINITTTASNWEAESSANWCTFSKNGKQITIRVTASTQDRTAVISFKGFDTKITVHQSKYAVGDSYNEKGIEGTVGYIGDEVRYIYKDLGRAAWSTEDVQTGATSRTDGQYNMGIIKTIPNWKEIYPAFALCEALNTNNISGWYLPAFEENFMKIDTSTNGTSIWTSTESGNKTAYFLGFTWSWGGEHCIAKRGECRVYAVHKF